MSKKEEKINIGPCCICDRDMIKGPSVDDHHFTPKCCGGKETTTIHKVCHNKIHKMCPDEKELARLYNTPELVKAHPEMQKFIKWVSKKDPEFYDKSDKIKSKKRRR